MVRASRKRRASRTFSVIISRGRPPGAPELSVNPIAAPGVYHFAEIYYVFNNLNVMKDWPWGSSIAVLPIFSR
jgi:hypothetical protein